MGGTQDITKYCKILRFFIPSCKKLKRNLTDYFIMCNYYLFNRDLYESIRRREIFARGEIYY